MNFSCNSLAKGFATAALLAGLASSAFGNPTVVLNPGTITENPQLQGGEFTASSATLSNSSYAASARGSAAGSFETFCMAYDQEFSYGEVLGYTLTNHTADPGAGSIQALTVGTAYLYSQFAKGSLLITTGAQDTQFQLALWWLQNSHGAPAGTFTYDATNTYEHMVYTMFGGTAGAQAAAGSNNDGVSIILTTHSNGSYSQPQLYYTSVPDNGMTVTLLGLALLGLAAFRKKFRIS